MYNFDDKPERLFIIDGIGAVISSFFLGIILVRYEPVFGIPIDVLYILATLPLVFLCYDIFCFVNRGHRIRNHLRVIALLNFSYCILSLGMAFGHSDSLLPLGWAYLIIEISIVLLVAFLEWKTSNSIN